MSNTPLRIIIMSGIAVLCYADCAEAASARLAVSRQPTTQQSSASTPEMAEADKLALEVAKLYQQGKFADAVPLARQMLKLREKSLGANHPLVAEAVTNLALLYIATNKPADAESLFKRALKIYEKSPDHDFMVARILENIALLREAREPGKAEELYLRAIAIKERVLSADHTETLSSLKLLADFYMRNRNYSRAETTLQRLIASKEKQLGQSNQEIGSLLERLACAMYKNNEKSEAGKVEGRANHILYGDAVKNPEPISLPNEVFECKLLTNPRPDFPAAAMGGRFTGSIRLVIAVEADEAGNVTSANLVSGNPLFKQASEKAALGAKLRPTVVDSQPVKVRGAIIHMFLVEQRLMLLPVRP